MDLNVFPDQRVVLEEGLDGLRPVASPMARPPRAPARIPIKTNTPTLSSSELLRFIVNLLA